MKKLSKILALVLVLMMMLSVLPVVSLTASAAKIPGGTKLYLVPSANWNQSNARFAAYFFGDGEAWVSMTKVAGESNLYEVTAPAGKNFTNVIFCRMNPSATANNWNNKWNQTSDLVYNGTSNCYTVKEGTWDKGGGTWSTYASECAHTNVGAAATCTTDQVCLDCGDPVVSALGHTYNSAHLCTRCNGQAAFTVAGSGAHLGTEWDTGNTANDMTYANGTYTKVYTNVAAGSYLLKVARDHDWGTAYPYADKAYTVATAGSTVTVTLKGTAVTITVEAPHTHAFSDATCTEAPKCSCGETQGEALGHDFVKGVCSRCEAVDPDYVPLITGTGTEEDPFVIGSLEALIAFRDSVNAGETTYNAEGVYVALGADIDMAEVDWSVNIGDDCNATFDGIFDGKGHKILNLNAKETAQKGDGYVCAGLFGAIYGNAVIKNLTIENVSIDTGDFTGNNVAAVVGFVYAGKGSIENVTVCGKIEINAPGIYGVGAIVGYSYNSNFTIENCKVEGAEDSYIKAVSGAGAVIGYANGAHLVNAEVSGLTIEGAGLLGGLVGIAVNNSTDVNGAHVANVTLNATKDVWVNGTGIAVGTLSSNSIKIEGVTFENVTGADTLLGSAYAEKPETVVPAFVARIGDVYYTDIQEAIAAAQAGETVYVFAGTYALPSMKAGIAIEGVGEVLFEGTLSGTLENLTLKNLHIKGGNAQRWAYAKGDLVFENVIFEATGVYALHFDGITEGATLLYKDCTIIGWAAMSGSPASCVFDGCTIKGNGSYGVIRTYFDATIENCTFDVSNVNPDDVYQDGIHAVDATVTVNNCTNVNGEMKDIIDTSNVGYVVLDGETIHIHKYDEETVAATCTTAGSTTYTCPCGHTYTEEVEALGHDIVVDSAAVDATCTATGLTAAEHCSRCDYVKTQEEVAALGHVDAAPCDHECDVCGLCLTDCVDANNNHKCDVCDDVMSTCTDADKNHFCDICGVQNSHCIDIPPYDHKCDWCGAQMSEHVYDNACDADCNYCGAVVEGKGHVDAAPYDHECDVCGLALSECVDANNNHKCDVCGDVMSTCTDADQNHFCDICGVQNSHCIDLPPYDHNCDWCGEKMSEHNYVDGICGICGAEDPNYVPPHVHAHEAVVTAPTCTAAGYTTYTCACGDTYTEAGEAALGHTYENCVCTGCGAVLPTLELTDAFDFTTADGLAAALASGKLGYTGTFRNNGDSHQFADDTSIQFVVPANTTVTLTGHSVGYGVFDVYVNGVKHDMAGALTFTVTEESKVVVVPNAEATHSKAYLKSISLAEYVDRTISADTTITFGSEGNYKGSIVDFSNIQIGDNGGNNSQVKNGSFDLLLKAGSKVVIHGYPGYTSYKLNGGEEITDEYYTFIALEDMVLTVTPVSGNNYFYSIEVTLHTGLTLVDAKAPTCTEAGYNAYYACDCHGELTDKGEIAVLAHDYKYDVCSGCGAIDPAYADVTHRINFSTWEKFDKETYADGTVVKYNDIFSFIYSKNAKIDGSSKVWDDFAGTLRFSFGSKTPTGKVPNKAAIQITVDGAYTVKLWYVAGGDARYFALLDSTGAVISETTKETTKNGQYYAELVIPAAGVYYLGTPGDNNYLFQIELVKHEHTAGAEATCTTAQTCTTCGAVLVAALGHNHEAVVTAPTCTEAGYTTYTCACGDTYTGDEVAALGHTFVYGKCTVCGEVDPDYVPYVNTLVVGDTNKIVVDGDTFNDWGLPIEWVVFVADEKATYSFVGNNGALVYIFDAEGNLLCGGTGTATLEAGAYLICIGNGFVGELNVAVTKTALPHEHAHEAVVTAPTCTEAGYTTYTCECGDTYVADEVPATGHTFVDGECACGEKDPEHVAPVDPVDPEEETEETEELTGFAKIWKAILDFFASIVDFFKGIFKG